MDKDGANHAEEYEKDMVYVPPDLLPSGWVHILYDDQADILLYMTYSNG